MTSFDLGASHSPNPLSLPGPALPPSTSRPCFSTCLGLPTSPAWPRLYMSVGQWRKQPAANQESRVFSGLAKTIILCFNVYWKTWILR